MWGRWSRSEGGPKGKVSIIIPTCAAKDYVTTCLETLRAKTAYRDFEIICIDNIPRNLPKWKKLIRKGADKVVDIPEAFNWSRFNNLAVRQAAGKYALFLNDDIEVQQEDWLDALLEHAQRPEVGVVGPQLLYPDRKVQHAGIFLTTLGAGRHSFRFLAEDDPGYFGLALTQRNVAAVTGACMLMRRDVFDRIGRFDEAHEVVNNDVDFCLRSWQAGLSVVYTPHAQLVHHEMASRADMKDVFDAGHFAKQWRTFYAAGDPFFSPRLTKYADEYRPDTEPARLICPSRPLFHKDAIERILAVKLDHIGDLITALRRLRMHFPTARIHLLGSGAARAFLAGEDCVDELIEFEFFHARSGLGQKELTDEDLRALGERLVPPKAATAVPALRINAECNCSGPADIAVGPVRYRDDRTGQIVERAFRPSAARATAAMPARFQVEPGQPITQNAPNFPVTPDHPYTIQVPMRTNQTSAGSGYVALVFLDAAGKELERLRLPFEPAERPIGTLTTDAQGRFSLLPDAATLRASVGFRAEFAGDARYRTASATLR